MIGIWYNPHIDNFYAKYVRSVYFHRYYKVGYINQYDHKLVALFVIRNNTIIKVDSFEDYYYNKSSFKKKLISKIIQFLERRI